MTNEQYMKLPPDKMFEAAQELLKRRRVVRVDARIVIENGFKGPLSYLRNFGINSYRCEGDSFFDCHFVEVDNLLSAIPDGVHPCRDYVFEDKRLIFEPTNQNVRSFIEGGSGLITNEGFVPE
jgi:hypothetical protein